MFCIYESMRVSPSGKESHGLISPRIIEIRDSASIPCSLNWLKKRSPRENMQTKGSPKCLQCCYIPASSTTRGMRTLLTYYVSCQTGLID